MDFSQTSFCVALASTLCGVSLKPLPYPYPTPTLENPYPKFRKPLPPQFLSLVKFKSQEKSTYGSGLDFEFSFH